MFYRGKGHFIWLTGIGSFNLIAAVVCPSVLIPLKKFLDLVILCIGHIVNFISLTAVFYLIFAPLGFLFRLFRKDMLSQRIDKLTKSYWIERKHGKLPIESYERMG
jgi:hypothetical protein